MLIRKHQSGGIAYLPTASRRGAAQAAASSSESGKIPGFAKELIDIVKENGLDSDVSDFLRRTEQILAMAGDPTGNNLTMREILKVQRWASQVATNYKDYQEARKSLDTQNAWGEMATDKRGYLYVQTKEGNIEKISPRDYDPEKYLALTNADLLNLRRTSSAYAYNGAMIDDVSSAVGMTTITDYVKNLAKEFGKTTITGYSEKQNDKINTGLQHLIYGDSGDFRGILTAGPDGVYKISQESTVADTGINEALNYLLSALPNNYKNTLSAKAAVEGYSPQAMLAQMILYNTDRKISADYEQSASKSAGFGNAGGSEQLTQGTLPDEISRGHLQQITANLSPYPERVSDTGMMAIAAWNGGPLTNDKKERLYANNLESLLPQIYGIVGADTSQITFGNQVIKDYEKKAIVWDGQSNITRVALPKKIAPNGQTTPDFDLLIKFNEVNKYIKDHPGMSELEIKQRLGDISQDVEVDDEGKLIIKPEKMGIFLSFAGYASRELINIDKNASEKFLKKLDRADGRAIKDSYNRLVQYGKLDVGKKTPKIHDVEKAESNDFYYGNIYIPVNDSTQGFRMSNEEYYPKDTFRNVAEKQMIGNRIQQNRSNDSWVYNYD